MSDSSQGSPPDLSSAVSIVCDPRVFALFCALNECGYDAESSPGGFHPIRREIRRQLGARAPHAAADFAAYFSSAPVLSLTPPAFPFWPRVAVMSEWALHVGPPREFELPADSEVARLAQEWPLRVPIRPREIEPLIGWLRGLGSALAGFWRAEDLEPLHSLWAARFVQAAAVTVGELATAVNRCLHYVAASSLPFSRLVVVPNPLQDSCTANLGLAGGTFYVVEGRCPARIGSVWHELCHLVVAPVLEQHSALVASSQTLLARVEQPMQAMGYWLADPTWSWRRIVEESLVRAVCARLEGQDRTSELVTLQADRGFALVTTATLVLQEMHKSRGRTFAEAIAAFLEHLARDAPG